MDGAGFVNLGDNAGELKGGFVLAFVEHFVFFDNITADASRNITATFGLQRGILSITPHTNVDVYHGPLGDLVDPLIDQKVSTMLGPKFFLKTLAKQAVGITALSTPPMVDCSGPPSQSKPAACFIACDNVPSALPAPADANNPDDPSWYAATYCGRADNDLFVAATGGAMNAGLSNEDQNAIGVALTGVNLTTHLPPDTLPNVRCNFHPSYVIPDANGNVQPVCEVIARAKRINVFPDQVEVVFFDGPSFNPFALRSEFTNPALGLFFALRSRATSSNPNPESALCGRNPAAGTQTRRFAHGALQPLCNGEPCTTFCQAPSNAPIQGSQLGPSAASTNTAGSGSASGCTGSVLDNDVLQSVDVNSGSVDALRFPGPALARYRHTNVTQHEASTPLPTGIIGGNPQRPSCDGLAHDWDAKVAKLARGQTVDAHEWLVALAAMANGNCPAQITVDCAHGSPADALTIHPFTSPH
jgi:hypothetical protein